jgi:hypothetical protein
MIRAHRHAACPTARNVVAKKVTWRNSVSVAHSAAAPASQSGTPSAWRRRVAIAANAT